PASTCRRCWTWTCAWARGRAPCWRCRCWTRRSRSSTTWPRSPARPCPGSCDDAAAGPRVHRRRRPGRPGAADRPRRPGAAGDPHVFGRAAEETRALRREGVPYEVVPGVSSAVAGPAAAGIPVTYRGVARSLLVVTGHEPVAWERLRADTVVVLMGRGRLARI